MTALPVSDPWLACRQPRPGAAVRLFCLPYAGGGASVFSGWADAVPPDVEVCPVQFPGRETRFAEPAVPRLDALVQNLAFALRRYLDRPFAIFGHSLGALVGFEVARLLRREHGLEPAHLFASACAAPQVREGGRPVHGLPDAEFRDELRRLNGTPVAVLANDELMEFLLPLLRADFAAGETYRYAADRPLSCPVTALGGRDDRVVTRAGLGGWREQTTGPFRLRMLPGDHFFLHSARPLLLGELGRELADVTRGADKVPILRVPAPGRDVVHVWRVPLDQPGELKEQLGQTLSDDEDRRAGRFRFRLDRDRFVVCRGALRAILGRYLERGPAELRFAYGPRGKPELTPAFAGGGLRFNVAHADGLALVAVARGRAVGVDLEQVRDVDAGGIAGRFFSAREATALRRLPPDLRAEAFFHGWTRKEAYLKATGDGLPAGLQQFDVSLAPGEPAALLAHRGDPPEADRWSLWELAPAPGYVGALAVEGRACRPRWRDWSSLPAVRGVATETLYSAG